MTAVDLKALADRVRHELETYEIPERHPEMLGSALPPSWYEEKLTEMREGLVEPYWTDVVDYDSTKQAFFTRKVVIVAHDKFQNYLAYDPRPKVTAFDDDFAMVGTEDGQLKIYDIRGDAVGNFLSF
jgi:hypothetical protein